MLKLATKCAPEARALKIVRRAGYRYVELWLDQTTLANWQAALRHARRYANRYALHFPNQLDLTWDSLEHTVALYRALECHCLIIHQPMYEKYGQALLRLEPELCLGVENHWLSLDGLADWAERSPGMTLDVEHLWKFTLHDSPLEKLLDQVRILLTRYGEKLRHVHLPGYWPGFEEHRPMYCAREMILPVLSLLAEACFGGVVVSEVSLEYQNFHELRMDALLFDAWRRRHAPPPSVTQSPVAVSLKG